MTAVLPFDTSTDYLCWENLEEVRVYPAPRLDLTSFPVLKAKRRAPSMRELVQGNGAYTGDDLVWIVPALELQQGPLGFEFHPADVLRDHRVDPYEPVEWTVLSAAWNKLRQTWRLMTRSLALNFNLRDSVTILRPFIGYGSGAEPVFNWAQATAIVTGIAAQVQPMSAAPETHNEVIETAVRYTVTLGQQVRLQAFDRIQATIKATGETILLMFERHTNQNRLDELPSLQCVRVG